LYDAAIQRCKEAGVDLDKARKDLDKAKKKLRDWEGENGDENDKHRQLKQEVNDADQRYRELDARFEKCNQRLKDANNLLKDAERRLKDARAAAAAENAIQSNAAPTTKKQRLVEFDISQLNEYILVAQKLSLEESDVGNLVPVPVEVFQTNCCNGLFIRQEYLDVANIIKEHLTSVESTKRVLV